ncbi:MAG: histidine phosphatase family protein [Proteobacteria bacterium]|nr:histidine phosphatase family protein [Pseudomonadota bacterium]
MAIIHKSFYFMRHGETDWNRRHIYMGQTDIPLNEFGIQQARQAAKLLEGIEFTSIASSNLIRAIHTAQIIAEKVSKPITIIDDLKECSLGTMEGLTKENNKFLDLWSNSKACNGIEEFYDFKERVVRGLKTALELPGTVLIIAHGGVYWAIQDALRLPFQDLSNCSVVYHRPPEQQSYPWKVIEIVSGS